MESHQENGAKVQGKLKLPGRSQGYNKLKPWILPGAALLFVALGWYLVIQQWPPFIIMSLANLAALGFLIIWTQATIKQEQARKALEDSHVLYQSLVNTLPRRIYRKDKQNRFVFGNQAFLDEFGHSLAEIVGKTDFDFYPAEIASKHQKDDIQVLLSGKMQETVEVYSLADGQKRYIQLIKSPVFNSRSEVIGLQGISWDVTRQRHAELERERLLEAEREQRLLAETLGEVFLALTAQTSYEAVLDEILRQIRRIVACSAANIMLLQGDIMKIVRWHGYENLHTETVIAGLEQPLADFPIDTQVVRSRQAVVIPDVQQEPQWIMTTVSPWIKSFMAVPICLQDRVLGILRLDSNLPYNFSSRDLNCLQPLANAAAIALENARLYDQAQQEIAVRKQTEVELVQRNAELLALLYAGATISTSLDIQIVLETITREMTNLLGAERSTIFQWDEVEDRISIIAGFGLDHQWKEGSDDESYHLAEIPLARRVLVKRYAQQMIITQSEITETDRAYMTRHGAKTLLLLPMEFQNRIIGLIQVIDNQTERHFTYVEIGLAQLLTNQAASALENAKLHKLVQESEANLKAIFENSLQVFVLIDLEAKVQAFNRTAAEGVRLTSGKEISRGAFIYDFASEAEKEELKQSLARTIQGEAIIMEKKVKVAQREKWFEYRYNPVFSDEGQVVGICFSTIDIDERKRAADTLAASEARLLAEMQSVLSITRALVSETQLNRLLDFIITQAKQLMKTDGAVVLLLSEDRQYLELTPLNDSNPYPLTELQLPLRGSLAELAIATHTVQTSHHSLNDDFFVSIRKLLAPTPIHTLLYAPLEIQGQALGVLLLWSKEERKFTDRDSYLVYLFADQAALALYNARLHVENRRLAIEQERQRLARELHDSVTQSLYSIGMAAQASLRLLNQRQESRLPDPIKYIHQLSQTALAEMRERVYDLHPTVLKDRDLIETLKDYCDMLREQYGLTIDFTADKDLEFSIYQRENLYYIAREALWNVVKHAGPTHVKVQLTKGASQIVLSIADLGSGFALSAFQRTEMMGLRSMEERAKLLMGSFEIRSEAESGTQIVVQIPAQLPQADQL